METHTDSRSTNGVSHDLLAIPLPESQTGQVSRSELVRMLADGLRDLGYESSAQALEVESGTASSSRPASTFLNLLSNQKYDEALTLVDGLPFKDGQTGRRRAKDLIVQDRYVNLIAQGELDGALKRLHQEIHTTSEEDDEVDELAALLACPTLDALGQSSSRLRACQVKRFRGSTSLDQLLNGSSSMIDCIRILLDSDAVVPPRRLLYLLGQALARQAGENVDLSRLEGEPLPLLRDLRELEETRNTSFVPSEKCRFTVQVGSGPTEVWSVCISDDANGSHAILGTSNGSIAVVDTHTGLIIHTIDHVFGQHKPIVSLDWLSPFGILLVSRSVGRPPNMVGRRRSEAGSGTAADEDESEDDEDTVTDERDVSTLVRVMPLSATFNRPLTSIQRCIHGGSPLARWTRDGQVVTAGPDGWIRTWSQRAGTASWLSPTYFRIERVVDMAPLPDRSGVVVACADNVIRLFRDGVPMSQTVTCPGHVVAISCGFTSLAVTMKNQTLLVWNMRDILSARPGSTGQDPLVFKGFSRKRFVLRPAVGHGDFVAVGSEDGVIHVFSTFSSSAGGQSNVVASLKGHTACVNEVCFARNVPGMLVSVGDDGSARIWTRRESYE